MGARAMLGRVGLVSGWSRQVILAVLALVVGFGLLPLLIFFAGSATLGRYEGAGIGRLYDDIYRGLVAGSPASWVVVLGPYGFYLLYLALRLLWRLGARTA